MNEINGDLLRDVAFEVYLDEESWDQGTWNNLSAMSQTFPQLQNNLENLGDCGTTCCVAGWTVRLANVELFKKITILEFLQTRYLGNFSNVAALQKLRERLQNEFRDEFGLDLASDLWRGIAAKLLNITTTEADHLFDANHGPLHELTAAQALEKIAVGTPIHEVWGDPDEYELDEDDLHDLEDLRRDLDDE